MKKIIYLQKIGEVDKFTLKKLKKDLKWAFKELIDSVEILPDALPLADSDYDLLRRQYNASSILNKLKKQIYKKQYFRTLGVIDNDIFSGFLNFVFGVAKLPRNQSKKFSGVALISITRLREKFYRRPENKALFELRVLKEAVHELGHTFGLKHCGNDCIMQFSNCLADTDEKSAKYCQSCSEKLGQFFKNLE